MLGTLVRPFPRPRPASMLRAIAGSSLDAARLREALGEVLRDARRRLGLTIREAAARSGTRFRPSAIGGYERGERAISLERFCDMAALYGIPPDRLLADVLDRLRPEGRAEVMIDLTRLELLPGEEPRRAGEPGEPPVVGFEPPGGAGTMPGVTHGSPVTTEPFSLQPHRPPRRRRRIRPMLLIGGVLLVLAVGAGMVLLLPARAPLLDARSALVQGRDAVVSGDLDTAGLAFARAEASFDEALDTIGNPLTGVASWIPLLGQTPDAVRAAAEAGMLMARAGLDVAQAAEDLPEGVGALAPRDGTIPLDPLRSLTPALARALALADRATVLLEEAPRWVVPAEVTEPLETFTVEARGARRALAAATATAWALPAFLGADGAKRYFLGAQNPAELRGTGGLIGAYAIMTADQGRIDVGPFLDVELPEVADVAPLPPPGPDYEALYGSNFRSLPNVNLTPDFPTAATAIERLHEATTGTPVDGTILADPQALSFLLRAPRPAS